MAAVMKVYLHFERSEACAEAHDSDPNEVDVVEYEIGNDGPWVQLTYDTIRGHDGGIIAELGKDDGCWFVNGKCFSDVVISFDPGEK